MGGYGTWAWAAHAPHRFAAIAPVCGGWRSDETRAEAIETLKALPHWVTHAANDKIVPVATSDSMVEELKAAGAEEVVYRRYEQSPAPYQPTDDSPVRSPPKSPLPLVREEADCAAAAAPQRRADGTEGAPLAPQDLSGHDSWTQTYTDPEFFRWLLAHSRSPDAAM